MVSFKTNCKNIMSKDMKLMRTWNELYAYIKSQS